MPERCITDVASGMQYLYGSDACHLPGRRTQVCQLEGQLAEAAAVQEERVHTLTAQVCRAFPSPSCLHDAARRMSHDTYAAEHGSWPVRRTQVCQLEAQRAEAAATHEGRVQELVAAAQATLQTALRAGRRRTAEQTKVPPALPCPRTLHSAGERDWSRHGKERSALFGPRDPHGGGAAVSQRIKALQQACICCAPPATSAAEAAEAEAAAAKEAEAATAAVAAKAVEAANEADAAKAVEAAKEADAAAALKPPPLAVRGDSPAEAAESHLAEDVLLCKESEGWPAEELCGAPCGATDASQRTCDSPAAVATAAEEEEGAMDSFVQYVYPLPPAQTKTISITHFAPEVRETRAS
jgi:hypothetical protein